MVQSSIKAGAIISYISILLNILISLIYTPWMIHEIGMSDYGIYSLIVSFLSYFLLDFGLGSAISRFIARYRADNNAEGINKIFSIATVVYACLSLFIGVILVVIYFFLEEIFVKLTPNEIEVLRSLYIIAGFFSICNFSLKPYDGALMAFEHFVPLKCLDLTVRVGTVLLISIALLFGGDVYCLVFINGAVAMIVSCIKIAFLYRKEHLTINVRLFDKPIAKGLFGFSVWVFLINIAQRLRLNIVPTILGIFCGTTEISIFAVGMNLEGFIYHFTNALNGLFIPKVSRMVKSKNAQKEIMDLMIKVGRIQLLVVGFIILGLFGLGHSFIHLWIGDSFYKTYYVMVLLVAVNLISMTQHIGTTLSYVINEVKYNSIFAISTSLVSLLLSIIFAPQWGAIGCGIAVFVALTLNIILLNIFYSKKLHLDIGFFFRKCHAKILPFQIILLIVLIYIDQTGIINNWGRLIMAGGVYTVVFALMMYNLVMNEEEKMTVNQIIDKIWKQK